MRTNTSAPAHGRDHGAKSENGVRSAALTQEPGPEDLPNGNYCIVHLLVMVKKQRWGFKWIAKPASIIDLWISNHIPVGLWTGIRHHLFDSVKQDCSIYVIPAPPIPSRTT